MYINALIKLTVLSADPLAIYYPSGENATVFTDSILNICIYICIYIYSMFIDMYVSSQTCE